MKATHFFIYSVSRALLLERLISIQDENTLVQLYSFPWLTRPTPKTSATIVEASGLRANVRHTWDAVVIRNKNRTLPAQRLRRPPDHESHSKAEGNCCTGVVAWEPTANLKTIQLYSMSAELSKQHQEILTSFQRETFVQQICTKIVHQRKTTFAHKTC